MKRGSGRVDIKKKRYVEVSSRLPASLRHYIQFESFAGCLVFMVVVVGGGVSGSGGGSGPAGKWRRKRRRSVLVERVLTSL